MRIASYTRFALGAALVTAAVAGCGGTTDHTSAAALCLRNALANQSIGSGPNNCADSSAASVMNKGSGTRLSVTCTHQSANEYICDVTGTGTKSISSGGFPLVRGGFYDVVYDGKSITYQPH